MCSAPDAPKEKPPPDLLITARDGEVARTAAARRKRGNLRVDLNNSASTAGLTIPRGE